MARIKAILTFKACIEIDFDNSNMKRKKYAKDNVKRHILGIFDSFKKNRMLNKLDFILSKESGNATEFIKSQIDWKKKFGNLGVEFISVKYIPSICNYSFKRNKLELNTSNTESENKGDKIGS